MVRDMTGFRDLARNRDFSLLWTGEAVSQLGTSVSMFVFPLLGFALTGSTSLAALAEAAFLLGFVGMLLPAGVLADRFHRRRLMLLSSGLGAVVYVALAAVTLAGALTLPLLVVGALLTGAAGGLFGPAETAALRIVVPTQDLPTALSQNQARQHVASLLGGPLGGLLYTASRSLPFLANALSYLVSCVTLTALRTDLAAPARGERSRVRADLVEGFSYLWRHPVFRPLLAYGALSNLVVNAVFTMAVLRMVQAHVAPAAIGLVETCAGIGGIVGALLAPRLIERVPTGALMVLGGWSWVPLAAPLAFTASPWVVGPCVAVGLLLNPAGNAAMGSYRVAVTPGALIGRTSSAMQFTAMAAMPLAPVLAGVLLHAFGPASATLGLLGCIAVAALVPTLSRPIRSIPRPSEWSAAAPARQLVGAPSGL
jgi:MFS family permease